MKLLGKALRVSSVDRHKQEVVMGDRFNVRLTHRMTAKRLGPTNDAAEQCDGPTHRPAASRKLRSTRSGDEDLISDDGNNGKMAPSKKKPLPLMMAVFWIVCGTAAATMTFPVHGGTPRHPHPRKRVGWSSMMCPKEPRRPFRLGGNLAQISRRW